MNLFTIPFILLAISTFLVVCMAFYILNKKAPNATTKIFYVHFDVCINYKFWCFNAKYLL